LSFLAPPRSLAWLGFLLSRDAARSGSALENLQVERYLSGIENSLIPTKPDKIHENGEAAHPLRQDLGRPSGA
jgi:hypothetical protein